MPVTVVKSSRIALAQLDPDIIEAHTGKRWQAPVFGHAKLIVIKTMQRDADWLLREVGKSPVDCKQSPAGRASQGDTRT